jgi:putative ABC transport system permease protein
LKPQGLALVESSHVAVADIATVQEFVGALGRVDRIDLILKPQSGPQAIDRLRELLPRGIFLRSPAETKATGEAMIHAYQLILSVLSFVSLFVGMFLGYSMISMTAASRRGEIAILRSLGASSRLVFAAILAEGFIMGALGWLVAIPIGSLLIRYVVGGVSSTIANLFVRIRVEGLQLDVWEVLLSLGVTLSVCLLAAYRPARESTRVNPREAMVMHEAPAGSGQARGPWTIAGFVLIGLAWPVSQIPPVPGLPLGGYASVLLLVVGFSLLSPPLLNAMGSVLPRALRFLGGEPAFMAARYLRDAGKRTSISVGALVTAVALFVSLVIMVHSFRQTVSLWVEQTLAGDLFVRPSMAEFNQHRDTLPDEVVQELRRLPDDIELLPYRRLDLTHGKSPYHLEALDFETLLQHARFILVEGDMDRITPDLTAGRGVLVSEVFRNKAGLGVGDRFQTQLGETRIDLPVLGVFRGYRTRGGVVHMDFDRFQRLTGEKEWSGVRFFFKDRGQDLDGAAAQLKERILKCCGSRHPLQMAVGGTLRKEVMEIFDQTFAITTVLLLIALLVAGLGITTTLTVLVLERIRQLNTLVAVGASEGQVRAMIFWEALLMVAAGEAIGLLCGFVMSYFLIYVINLQSFGWTFLYRIDWGALMLSLPLILGTALLAAMPAVKLALHNPAALVLKEQ